MHFSYFQSDIHRKEYWPKLSEIMTLYGLGPYSKGREDMYHTVTPLSGGSTPACAEGAAAPFLQLPWVARLAPPVIQNHEPVLLGEAHVQGSEGE